MAEAGGTRRAQCTSANGTPAVGGAVPAKKKKRRSRRKKAQERAVPDVEPFMEVDAAERSMVASGGRPQGQVPPRSDAASSTAVTDAIDNMNTEYPEGSLVMLNGLASRPELNGTIGSVVSHLAGESRTAIRLASGEKVRIKSCNMVPSIFSPGMDRRFHGLG